MGGYCCSSNEQYKYNQGPAGMGSGGFNPNLYFSEQLTFNSAKVAMSKTVRKLLQEGSRQQLAPSSNVQNKDIEAYYKKLQELDQSYFFDFQDAKGKPQSTPLNNLDNVRISLQKKITQGSLTEESVLELPFAGIMVDVKNNEAWFIAD